MSTATINATDALCFSTGTEADHWADGNCARCTLAMAGDWCPETESEWDAMPCPMQRAIWEGWILGTVPTVLATKYGATLSLQGRYPGVYQGAQLSGGRWRRYWAGTLPDSLSEPVEEFTAYCHMPPECPQRIPGQATCDLPTVTP